MVADASTAKPALSGDDALRAIAADFVAARRAARALTDFPGVVPRGLEAAYRCQDFAIEQWPDEVVGWKVGWIAPEWQERLGEERLVGPVFRRELREFRGNGSVMSVAVFERGFGAIEAEYAFRIGRDLPGDRQTWTPLEAADVVDGLHVAVEIASSPLESINRLGPAVVASDFGNNAGLLVGPRIGDWSPARDEAYTCRTEIEGEIVGRGGSAALNGGPLAALAFAMSRCARRGRPLRAGQWVTTGAVTGIHEIAPGQTGRIVFDGIGELRCKAVARAPVGDLDPT